MQDAGFDMRRNGDANHEGAEGRGDAAQIQAMTEALETARRERDAAQAAANCMAAKATAILERLQANEAAFARMQDRLLAMARQCMASDGKAAGAAPSATADTAADSATAGASELVEELKDVRAEADAFRAQLENERRRMAQELDQVRTQREIAETELESLRAERGNLTMALEAARGRIGALEKELDKARRQASLQAAELDALRRAAAQQVAAAQVQAGELEQRIARAKSALDALRQTCRATDSSLRRQAAALLEAAHVLNALADRHAIMKKAGLEGAPSAGYADRQGFLFAPKEGDDDTRWDEADALSCEDAPAPPSPQHEQLRAIAEEVLRVTPAETPHND